jgi:UDP-glucose 4-epimerase
MNNEITILLTGGLGFIGSHIATELLLLDYNVIIIDNLSNSSISVLDVIYSETNKKPLFFNIDIVTQYDLLIQLFQDYKIDSVIHLAGLKSVNESVNNPIFYYETNLLSTINLIKVMEKYNCKKLIFSSSATVYGTALAPYTEQSQTGIGISNPYGKTKYFQEEMLQDLYKSDARWSIVILRYFNPISQRSEQMKEKPKGLPNNLYPYIVQVYKGELKELKIFGNDYNTQDGTCIRDFIHVVDLAKAHVTVCKYILNNMNDHLIKIYNVGTGNGISVKQLLDAFEECNNVKLNYRYVEKREGDLEKSFGDVSLINNELNWKTEYGLNDMVNLNF